MTSPSPGRYILELREKTPQLFVDSCTSVKTKMAMENPPLMKMYFLLKMGNVLAKMGEFPARHIGCFKGFSRRRDSTWNFFTMETTRIFLPDSCVENGDDGYRTT